MAASGAPRNTSPPPSSASSTLQRAPSESPSRRVSFPFTHRISALGAKISRTINGQGGEDEDGRKEIDSVSTTTLPVTTGEDRSQSRGREAFSTGRGGLGNIRPTSVSRTRPEEGPDDFSSSRGREPRPSMSPNRVYSTGRGGAGNIRSPSRDSDIPPGSSAGVAVPDPIQETEKEIIRNHVAASQDVPHSSGRGGLGNITSRSRSRGPNSALASPPHPALHSTGRGGLGNILSAESTDIKGLDEEERRKLADANEKPAYHSTGRGGLANIASGAPPQIEQVVHTPHAGEYGSTGRGGAGNIVRGA